MEQEFTTSTFYKIFYGGIALVLTGLSAFLFNGGTGKAAPVIFIIPVSMLAIAGIIAINLYKRKVVISDYSLTYTSVWGIKELTKTDIKGFRVNDKAIVVEAVTAGHSKVTIRDYGSIGDSKDLIGTLGSYYKDLNAIEFQEQKDLILQDAELGNTQEDRQSKLKSLLLYTQIYTYVGLAAFFSILYFHVNHPLIPIFLLIYPLIGISLFGLGKGVVRLFSKKNSPYPAVGVGIFFSIIALVFQVNINDQILDYHNFWLPAVTIGLLILVFLCTLIFKRQAPKAGQLIFALMISAGYSWGSTLQINCSFDSESPQLYKATVLSRHVTHGKSTTYHIILSEWGQHNQQDNIAVPSAFYNYATVNSQVNINLKKGMFNIPWYYLTQ